MLQSLHQQPVQGAQERCEGLARPSGRGDQGMAAGLDGRPGSAPRGGCVTLRWMRCRETLAAVVLCIGAMLVTPPSPADSPGPPSAPTEDALICPGHEIIILHDDAAADARQACRAADIAIKFMATHRFDTAVSVTIRIVDAPVMLHDIETIGTYDAGTSIITVPSFDHCYRRAAGRLAFGMEATRDLWRSFVVHELAHAVAQFNFGKTRAPRVSHEYIAYVVQIATMPSPLIAETLENYPNRAFASERAINQNILDLDPQVFAVKAYRHFLALDDGAAFFDRILTGDFRRFERD